MKTLVIYESMYGNTHLIAEQIAEGLRAAFDTDVIPVGDATPERLASAELLVVGGPTHVHGMSTTRTRAAAAAAAAKPEATVVLDAAADGGLREWFEVLADGGGRPAVAFDTRMNGPALFTGRASKGISQRLHQHGYRVIADPQSFIVGKDNHLSPESAQTAHAWAQRLIAILQRDEAAMLNHRQATT